MSEVAKIEKLNLSEVLNEAQIISTGNKTTTPRSRSDNVKQTRGTEIKRVIPMARKLTTDKTTKSTQRRRSLTMTDIRNKIPAHRTPIKHMKQDSCSTTDYSPRLSNEHPAEVMLTIRCRELQIRTFSKIFYSLWRKQKNLAENFRDEVSQLQVQTSFLKNLRDKECESREKITNFAEKLKTEIIDLHEQVSELTKDRDTLQNLCQNLHQEYAGSLEQIQKFATGLDRVHEENQLVIVKVKEAGDLMDARFIGLKRTLRWVEEINTRAQQYSATYNAIHQEQIEAFKTIETLQNTTKSQQEKLKSKEENEKNLRETIKELRKSLENSTAKTSDLKSEIKNINLQLEFAEHQLKEKEFQPNPWSIVAHKAARLSMYILFQVGLLPAF